MKENPLSYVISDVLQKMEQNTNSNIERDEKIFSLLFQLCKDKQNAFKQKFNQNKSKSLYTCLDIKNLIVICYKSIKINKFN